MEGAIGTVALPSYNSEITVVLTLSFFSHGCELSFCPTSNAR